MNRRNETLLVVDDEKELRDHLYRYLKKEGFDTVLTAADLVQAKFQFLNHDVDLIVLDVMLPDGSGVDFLKALRRTSQVPVIILSALDGVDDRREGFSSRADDYIVKPFLPEDLLWRIDAILRRTHSSNEGRIALQGAVFDRRRAVIERGGETIELTAKQFQILDLLAENVNRVVSIDRILEVVWQERFGYENTLVTHIYRLRDKLEEDPSNPKRLVTVKGLGYKLIGEE